MKKKLLSFLSLTAIAIFAFAATQSLRRAATTIWENADGVVVNWNGDVTVAKDKFANLKIGDIITVTVKDVAAGATKDNWKAQVSLRDAWWNTLEQDVPIAKSDTKAEFTVTGDIQAILQERGLMISGKGFSATKIEISDGTYTGSKNSIWIGNTTAKPSVSNFHFKMANGGYNDNDVWKNGVKAGDIIRIAATAIADFSGDKYCLLSYSGADTEYAWKDYQGMPAVATETGFDVVVTEGNVAQLMIDGIIVNQAGYTITQVELIPMYAVNVATGIENGTVEVDKATAAEGETVTVTATPADGYKLFNALARGVTTDVAIEVKNGKFTMPADAVTVSATFAQPEDIAISPESGADIYTALKAATTDAGKIAKNITINLAADGAYTVSAPIETAADLVIAGPATLTEGQKAPVIDASANADVFIQMSTSPIAAKNTKDAYIVDNISIKNVKITGIKNSFFWDNKVKYGIANFVIDNAVIGLAHANGSDVKNDAIISFQGGGIKDFALTNSTIYGTAKINYFLRYNGNNGRIDNLGYDKNTEKQSWTYEKNTFYQVLKSNGQWGNGPAGQKYFVYSVKDNIWYNSSLEIARRLMNGQLGAESDVTFSNNTYFNESVDKSANQTNYDKSCKILTTDPGFKDAANADFTIGASTAQALMKTGDPRWLVDYVAPASATVQNIEFAAEPGDISKQLTTKKYEVLNALNDVGNITINLAANGAYTLSAPIEGSSSITVAGPATLADGENAPVIDAEANTGAFVKMGTPIVAANAKGFYEVDNFAIKNVNVKNIKSYVYDDNKNAFAFAEFAVENCVFEFANTKQDIDAPFRFQAGGPVKFILKNNTMYQKGTKNYKYFVKIGSGNFPDKAFESFAGPYVWDIENNTFYQTIAHDADAKKAFINGGRVGNNFAKTSITILKNMFIDCAGSESFWKDLFGGKSSDSDRAQFVAINTDYNTYLTGGAVIDVSKYDKGENTLTSDPTFKDAANGDFTIGESTTQAKFKTGDPRWLVAFTGYTITMGTVTNGTVEAGGTSPYAAGEKVRLTLTPAEGYAIDNKPTFKNDEDVDVTELVTVGQDADGFYLVMPAFNITASYAFSKLYTITLPTETTHGTITIVKPEGTNKSVAGKLIKIKVTGLSDGYKVVAKNGDTDITLNEGDHATYDYYFEMPEGDVTISIVDATGINAISVDGAADIFADGKPVYNLAGQRVFKGYKGLVIKNGKKVVVK